MPRKRKPEAGVPRFTLVRPTLEVRRVWVGAYSEMTGTVVVIYSAEPTPEDGEYGLAGPLYVGSVWIEAWEFWFGTVQPFVAAGLVEYRRGIGHVSLSDPINAVTRVIPVDLEAPWDEHGWLVGLDVRADN